MKNGRQIRLLGGLSVVPNSKIDCFIVSFLLIKPMASRAEIEAQIAALKAVLKDKEIDPDFTPKELVRWDPTLLGTILHMKHPMNLPRTAFRVLFKNNGEYYGWVGITISQDDLIDKNFPFFFIQKLFFFLDQFFLD